MTSSFIQSYQEVEMLPIIAAVLPGFFLVTSTPRADYYSLDPDKLSVDVKYCEQKLAKMERYLGVQVPRFTYYRVASIDDVFQFSADGLYAGGFAHASPLYTVVTDRCSTHELAHLALFQLGRSSRVFEEGMASFLADQFGVLDRWNGRMQARRAKFSYDGINQAFWTAQGDMTKVHLEYVVSADFCRHIVDRYGIYRMARFLRTGTDDAFRTEFGETPQIAFNRWLYGTAVPR